jgi:hypothetical protein
MKIQKKVHLSGRRGHTTRENDDALGYVLFFQNIEQPENDEEAVRERESSGPI